jgi:hypothetical protein
MRNRIKTPFKAVLFSLCVALTMVGVAHPIQQSKVPELPLPDGSGDTPEIAVELYPIPGVESADKLKLSSLRGKSCCWICFFRPVLTVRITLRTSLR